MSSGGRRKSIMNFFNRSSSGMVNDDASSTASRSPTKGSQAAAGSGGASGGVSGFQEGTEFMEVFENERFRDQIGWSAKNLELDDPKTFTWADGASDQFLSPPPPDGYDFLGIWELDKQTAGTPEGWVYARSFNVISSNTEVSYDGRNVAHRTRRRRWIREMKRRDDVPAALGVETPHSSDDETQNTGSTEPDRTAEKYLFLKIGSGGAAPMSSHSTPKADEEDTRSSLTGGEVGGTQSLKWLGKQIRELELECEREADTAQREWKKTQYPMYKATAREIEKSIAALQQQIKDESNVSEDHVISLEETLKAHIDVLNATKKQMYFPNSNLSSGSADAFFAIDDFWVEDISGVFVVDMIGSVVSPQVLVSLTGTSEGPNSGISLKLKLEGFKLRAKGAPNISVQEAVLTACVKVSMMLTFVAATNKWQLLPADFRLDLLSFSGPYGLSRAFVSTILAMVSSKIREAILLALPMEIGHLLMTLPIPFGVRGQFSINGTPLSHLSSPLTEAHGLCLSLGFNPGHMTVFMDLQKKMGRGGKNGPLLKTMQDMINYRTMGAKNSKMWDRLRKLWSQAASIFVEMKVEEVAAAAFAAPASPSSSNKGVAPFQGYDATAVTILATFAFDDIIQAVEDVMRKPLSVEFKLHHISGQVSINQVVDKLRKLAHRLALISASTGNKKKKAAGDGIFMDKRVSALLKRATREFDEAKKVLAILAQNFDYGQVLADVKVKSGAAGAITVRASQILGRAPISIWLNLPQRLAFLGIHCPVPYVLAIKTDPEGNIVVEFNHCGSARSTRRGVYLQHEDKKDISQNRIRAKVRRRSINWRAQWASKLSKMKVQELEEQSKFHLSPLISISDSYRLPAEMVKTEKQIGSATASPLLSGSDKLGGKLHSSFSKISSTMKKVVPGKHRKKPSADIDDSDSTDVSVGKSSNIFLPTATTQFVSRQSFSSVPVTADDFDDAFDEDDIIEEEDEDCDDDADHDGDDDGPDGSSVRKDSVSQIDLAAMENNVVQHSENYNPPQPRTHIPILRSYRRKARLEQTLAAVPKDSDIVEVVSAIVYKPKVTIVTEKAVSLRAGAELLTFSLGKTSAAGVEDSQVHIEQVVAPTFRKRITSATTPTVVLAEGKLKRGVEEENPADMDFDATRCEVSVDSQLEPAASGETVLNGESKKDHFRNSGLDVPEYRRNVIGDADGSPVVVQTGTGIKVLVEVPRVDVRVDIADFLRFINRFMGSAELKAYLGARNEDEEGDFDELIAFVKAVVARAGKYFLLPGLQCELCIVGKLVVVNHEVVVKVETPVTNARPDAAESVPVAADTLRDEQSSRRDLKGDSRHVGFSSLENRATLNDPLPGPSPTRRGSDAPTKEDDEEDFWANHKAAEEASEAASTPQKKISAPDADTTNLHAAYVKISMNMMDVIEDHKVLTSLGQDYILSVLSRDSKRRTTKKANKSVVKK